MHDLTVVYYTCNYMTTPLFELAQRTLLEAIGDTPLISVSQKPMSFGENICVGNIGRKYLNIYRQQLAGVKAAKTRYVALAEDDLLFPADHFTHRPPADDVVIYEMNKWGVYPWLLPPCFVKCSGRFTVGSIAARDLIVDALEERFARWPDDDAVPLRFWAEVGRYERMLNVSDRKAQPFTSETPMLVFYHEQSFGHEAMGYRKRLPKERATELPYWGTAERIYEAAR